MNDAPTAPNPATDPREGRRISEVVVEAVADAKGVSTTDLRTPLYAVVDPDALDDLVVSMNCWSGESAGHVTFSYSGYEVTVSADGDVSLAESDAQETEDRWK